MPKRKLTITTIIIGVVFIGGGAILGLNSYFGESSNGFSSSLLPDWKYRRPITISGHTQDLTDYQVKIELPASLTSSLVSSNKLQSDFDDIRFTDADDTQLLNFWIETATTTATSTIWVKVPSLSANKSSVIYMYYGNSSASSASDGEAVFEFFDDFEDGVIDTSEWTAPGCEETGGELIINLYYSEEYLQSTNNFSPGNATRFRAWYTSDTDFLEMGFAEIPSTIPQMGDDAAEVFEAYTNSTLRGTSEDDGGNMQATSIGDYSNSYHTYDILWKSDEAKFYIDEDLKATHTTAICDLSVPFTVSYPYAAGSYEARLDWVLIRKYADPEPTATVGDEEENITPVAHWRFEEGSGSTAYDSTPNNNDCTWSGSGSHWTSEGKFNGGAIFNGTDDYLSCGDVGDIETISFWAKPKSLTQSIIDLNGTQTITLSSGTIQANNFTSPTIYVDGRQSSTFPDTNWHHIAITTESAISASAVYLGKVGSNYFDGILDDVRLYNYVRSIDEIRLDYNAGLAVKLGGSPSTKPAPPQVLWRFEEGSATTVYNNPVFLDGYSYERPINISGSSENLTDYQVLITLDTASLISDGKMKSNCSDIRFTDADDNQTLPYWIESGCNTTSTKIWVKVSSIPTSGTTIYMYYGNPSAQSESNGTATFLLFDDFEDGDISEWNYNSEGDWSVDNTIAYEGNYSMRNAEDYFNYALRPEITTSGGVAIDVMAYRDSTGINWFCGAGAFITNADNGYKIGWGYDSCHDGDSNTDFILEKWSAIPMGSELALTNAYFTNDTWYKFTLMWDSDGQTLTAQTIDDTGSLISVTATDTEYSNLHVGVQPYTQMHFDLFRVRKYTSSEPTATVGNEISKSDYAKATISGATFATGKFGKALKFDGANDYLATQSALNSQSQFSYSLWFQSSDGEYSTNEYLFNQGTDDPSAYIDNNGNLNIKINSSLKCQISNSNLKSQKWNHLEITGDTSTLKVYFNGALVCTANYTGSTANAVLYLGSASSTAGFFGGKIDDFRIYPYARSSDQVKIDSNAGFGIKLGGSPSPDITRGLVAYYNFDEGAGTTLHDISGTGNNGTLVNGPKWRKGKYGSALQFDGEDDYVEVSDSDQKLAPDALTFTAWIKILSGWEEYDRIVTKKGDLEWDATGWSLEINTNGLMTFLGSGGEYGDRLAMGWQQDTWHFVAITKEAGATVVKGYLDGIYKDSQTCDTISSNDQPLTLAYYSGQGPYLPIIIDEVRIYNRALSEEEIRYLYNKGKPEHQWRFEEGEGTTAYDSGEPFGGNDCSLSGTSFKKGILGTGLYFSGSASSSCGNIGNIKTLSFFVNPLSLSRPILDLDGGTNYIELSSGKIHLVGTGWQSPKLYVNGKQIPLDSNNYSTNTLSQAQWYHIEIVNSASISTSALTLGKVGASYFVGTLDEIKAYNYQRTPEQVKIDFNSGVGIRFK